MTQLGKENTDVDDSQMGETRVSDYIAEVQKALTADGWKIMYERMDNGVSWRWRVAAVRDGLRVESDAVTELAMWAQLDGALLGR